MVIFAKHVSNVMRKLSYPIPYYVTNPTSRSSYSIFRDKCRLVTIILYSILCIKCLKVTISLHSILCIKCLKITISLHSIFFNHNRENSHHTPTSFWFRYWDHKKIFIKWITLTPFDYIRLLDSFTIKTFHDWFGQVLHNMDSLYG